MVLSPVASLVQSAVALWYRVKGVGLLHSVLRGDMCKLERAEQPQVWLHIWGDLVGGCAAADHGQAQAGPAAQAAHAQPGHQLPGARRGGGGGCGGGLAPAGVRDRSWALGASSRPHKP